jgi:hypothetical protein
MNSIFVYRFSSDYITTQVNVYFVFKGQGQDLFSFDWWRFS